MRVTAPQNALDILNDIIKENAGEQPSSVRIYFAGVACSGPSFGLALDEQTDKDLFFEVGGINFIMSKDEYLEYGDIVIEDTEFGFRVIPEKLLNVPHSCSGCSGGCH